MKLKMMSVAALMVFAGAITVGADEKPPEPFDDATFVKMAAIDGMTEVKLGKIATEKAKNDDVKKFAEMMVKDHTKANAELKTAAKAANIPVPEGLDEKHQKCVDKFNNYTGTDFDADYPKDMVDDHTRAVELFTRASKEAKNPDIKNFATQTLPVIKGHLEMAKKLSK